MAAPLQPPSPAFELSPRYEYVGVPLEPQQPHPHNQQQYIIYGDEDDGPSTAEIIHMQSQDYVDEKLAQFEMMTIAKLQGMLFLIYIFFAVTRKCSFSTCTTVRVNSGILGFQIVCRILCL